MFDFFKKGEYIFESEPVTEGVLSTLKYKDKKVDINKINKDNKYFDNFEAVKRIIFSVKGIDLEAFHESTKGIFRELHVPKELCSIKDGGVLISYPLLYAYKFESLLDELGLPQDALSFLNLPEFEFLTLKVKFQNKLDSRNFKVNLSVLDDLNNEIQEYVIHDLNLSAIDGRKFFITPEQKALVEYINNFNSLMKTNINDRVKALGEIKSLSEKCSISLSDSIKKRKYINVEELKVTLGRNMNGEVIVEPDISPDTEVNRYFRNYYSSVGDLSDIKLTTVDEDGDEVFVTFDKAVEEDRKKIDHIKNLSAEEKDHMLHNPTEYFRDSQLEGFILEDVLSDRITGFLFGRPEGDDWSIEKNSSSWNTGYEGESLFLQSKDGYYTEIDLSTIPEFYPEIVQKIEEVKEKLADEELIKRLEDNDFFTPIPTLNNDLIKLSAVEGEYTLDSLVQLAKRIESENQPDLEKEDLEEARSLLEDTSLSDLIEWEEELIPHKSLRRAINKIDKAIRKEEKIDNVSFSLDPMEGELDVKDLTSYICTERPPHLLEQFNLKNHQVVGYSWLKNIWNNSFGGSRKGALLADDMGLGKTLQVISLISYVKNEPSFSSKPVLVVAPLSLIDGSWIEEGVEYFFNREHISTSYKANYKILNLKDVKTGYPKAQLYQEAQFLQNKMINEKLKFSELQLSSELSDYLDSFKNTISDNVIVTSYETMRSKMFELSFLDFSLVVLDEAQKIKSGSSLQNRAARSLKSDMNIAMTGTPIENGMMDLWNVMDFVYPMKLGSKSDFKNEFIKSIRQAKPGTVERESLKTKLEEKLSPFWLRRVKSDVLVGDEALPPITYFDSVKKDNDVTNVHAIQMSDEQTELYRQKMSIFNASSGGERLAIIRQLLEVCSAPWIPLDEKINYENFEALFKICPKLKVTFEILDNIFNNSEEDGRKVVIFANIIQVQNSLAYMIKEWAKYKHNTSIEVEVYNGTQKNASKRKDILKRFDAANGFKAVIISPKAGGAGLNIQAANHVIHYTREWNPALENQATARCYRIGQKRPVSVYFPTSIGDEENPTAEERLANILRDKRSIMDDFTISNREFDISSDDFVNQTSQQDNFKLSFTDLRAISSKQFENVIANIFSKLGYKAEVVGGANDRGADIICFGEKENVLIQVKQKQTSVKELNTTPINEIRGAKQHYTHQYGKEFSLAVVTNGNFSTLAHQAVAQGGKDVVLYDGTWISNRLKDFDVMFLDVK